MNDRSAYPASVHHDDTPSQSTFSLKRCAFQTIRPVVSRKKLGFSARSLPPRVLSFFKDNTLRAAIGMKKSGTLGNLGRQLYLKGKHYELEKNFLFMPLYAYCKNSKNGDSRKKDATLLTLWIDYCGAWFILPSFLGSFFSWRNS